MTLHELYYTIHDGRVKRQDVYLFFNMYHQDAMVSFWIHTDKVVSYRNLPCIQTGLMSREWVG